MQALNQPMYELEERSVPLPSFRNGRRLLAPSSHAVEGTHEWYGGATSDMIVIEPECTQVHKGEENPSDCRK